MGRASLCLLMLVLLIVSCDRVLNATDHRIAENAAAETNEYGTDCINRPTGFTGTIDNINYPQGQDYPDLPRAIHDLMQSVRVPAPDAHQGCVACHNADTPQRNTQMSTFDRALGAFSWPDYTAPEMWESFIRRLSLPEGNPRRMPRLIIPETFPDLSAEQRQTLIDYAQGRLDALCEPETCCQFQDLHLAIVYRRICTEAEGRDLGPDYEDCF